MIPSYIFGRNRWSCRILFAFGRGVVELLAYNHQASRKLFPVRCIITDQERLLPLRDDEVGDIHRTLSRDNRYVKVLDSEIHEIKNL